MLDYDRECHVQWLFYQMYQEKQSQVHKVISFEARNADRQPLTGKYIICKYSVHRTNINVF